MPESTWGKTEKVNGSPEDGERTTGSKRVQKINMKIARFDSDFYKEASEEEWAIGLGKSTKGWEPFDSAKFFLTSY